MTKPEIRIPTRMEAPQIKALSAFAALYVSSSYHIERDFRHPLGIYNTSLLRISKKISRCADRLEAFWNSNGAKEDLLGEVVDYLELSMYSAAEHVDDVNRIAMSFFPTDTLANNSKEVRLLRNSIKPIRSEISAFANTIKHAHGRIRLYRVNFVQGQTALNLVGFFIEGFKDGACAPSPILHSSGKQIISITSFLWSILTFLSDVSRVLFDFLLSIEAFDKDNLEAIECEPFQDAALKLARLPNYSFDDEHPFTRVRWVLDLDDDLLAAANSQIYGSLSNQWLHAARGKFEQPQLLYDGDGVTRSFRIVDPKKISLQHWS